MVDPLVRRSILAIEESRALRDERRKLAIKGEKAVYELRWAIYETACTREEIKAQRENRK
jgi:hypothetical protein